MYQKTICAAKRSVAGQRSIGQPLHSLVRIKYLENPTTITLSSNSMVLTSVGETASITATELDKDRKVITNACEIWRSSNESIATIRNTGLVTAVSGGTNHVTVSSSIRVSLDISTETISVRCLMKCLLG